MFNLTDDHSTAIVTMLTNLEIQNGLYMGHVYTGNGTIIVFCLNQKFSILHQPHDIFTIKS